ncbi:siderophore-interacting protein [Clostridium botulinum]|nr:siderophore-interacting protein [Clostridium botulinum]NFL41789.1 siderophore-interacting protein [Clostridium botulinum]NFN20786.1 siderophore-interacting protein [Clostridium botulinum]NFN42004.1 siderophore-interacting protein [Clostridium botulinum]NFO40895.1 siderophore-interacting protein [Clostridium botulinum]
MKELFKKTESILYNYAMLKAEINNLELEIEEIENEYAGIGAISYEERSGSTNKISDTVANEIVFKEKESYKLNKMKRSKEILLAKINNGLEALDQSERNFIQYRYLNGKRTWLEVGEILSLDSNYCCNSLRPMIINKLSAMIFPNR